MNEMLWIVLINGSIVIVVAVIIFVAIEIRKRSQFIAEKHSTINQIMWLINNKKVNEALNLLHNSQLNLGKLKSKARAFILYNYGKCFFDLAEIDPQLKGAHLKVAIQYYNSALKCYPVGRYLMEKTLILNELGRCFNHLAELEDKENNLAKAKSCLQNALSLISARSRNELVAKIKYNLGITYYNLAGIEQNKQPNLFFESIILLSEAAKLFYKKRKHFEYALSELALSISYRKHSRYVNQYENLLNGLEAVNQALVHLNPKKDATKFAQAQYNLGNLHLLLAKFESSRQHLAKSLRAFKRAATIFTITNSPLEYANINYKLMQLFFEAKKEFNNKKYLNKAIGSSHEALKVFTIERYPFSYASVNHQLGNVFLKLSEIETPEFNLKRAYQAFEETTKVFTSRTEPQIYTEIQMLLGKTSLSLFEYVPTKEMLMDSIFALETAITTNSFPSDNALTETHLLLGKAYCQLATIEDPQSNLKTALKMYNQVINFYNLDDNPVDYANLKLETGFVLKELATLDSTEKTDLLIQAISAFNDSLAIFSETNYPEKVALIHQNMGDIYYQLAQTTHPETNLKKALTAYDNSLKLNKDPEFTANVNFSKGNLFKQLAQYKDSSDNLNKAIQSFQNAINFYSNYSSTTDTNFSNSKKQALSINNEQLGDVYLEIALTNEKEFNITKAKRAYDKAIANLNDDSKQSARLCFKQGKTLQSLAAFGNGEQNIIEAIQFFEKALSIYKKENDLFEYALTLNYLGVSYQHLAEYSLKYKEINLLNSVQSLQEALNVFNIQKFPFEYAMTQNNLGTAYGMLAELQNRNDNLLLAMRAFDEALKIYTIQTHPDDYRKVIANQEKINARFRLNSQVANIKST